MCGICGQAYTAGEIPARETLERMNAALVHRGPDSDGYHLQPGIGLAMRRLAVIDLSTGDQPISNEDGSLWIVFNGEIFNHPQLRRELEQAGHRFKTRSDTECLLHLYEDFGDDLVLKLNGQFAFALWDGSKRKLLLGRDRLGEKPLYYCLQGGRLSFSSELSSLLQGLDEVPQIDLSAIDLYLSLQYIPDPLTVYSGVHSLPPAHLLTWQDGEVTLRRYWQLEYLPKWDLPMPDLEAALREKLQAAVLRRMIADVPLGAHLSGGIDSSIIVALMAEGSALPVETFSVGFEEQTFNELPFARAVSQRYGTHHHEFILEYSHLPETLQTLAWHFGQPFADSSALPLHLLSKLTRQHVTVALNGDGGDDLHAGYPRYGLDPIGDAYLNLPGWITRRVVPGLARRLPDRSEGPVGNSWTNGLKRLENLVQVDRRASILRWSSFFSVDQRRSLWRREFWKESLALQAEALLIQKYESLDGAGSLDRTLQCDLETYLAGDLLVKADRMSMTASLEARSPFLDHELAEWTARLPEALKLHGRKGKYLLKRAFAGALPAEVLRHKKQGFGIPVGKWLRGPLAGWSREVLLGRKDLMQTWFDQRQVANWLDEHQQGREDHGKRLWSLLMLGAWLAVRDRQA